MDRYIAQLPYAEGAALDSILWQPAPQCLANTRVDLLRQIMEWSNDPNGETIYWLKGMAGTGKSTVSRTVAHSFSNEKRLVASFFFSRNQVDLHHANKLITTLARELANTVPSLKRDISRAIAANNSRILQQGFREQWKHLILGPLDRLGDSEAFQPQSLISVIDAVDECESADDLGLILKTLSETKPLKGIQLRAFVTSRPEVSGNVEAARIFVLLPDPKSIDIEIFIKHELQKIRETREFELSDAWPGEEKIDLLVQRAEGLFIYAATACLFIGDKRFDPMKRLPLLLLTDGGSPSSSQKRNPDKLEQMYKGILSYSVVGEHNGRDKEELIQRFKKVVGPIAVVFEPFTPAALAKMLDVEKREIDSGLSMLSSVLHISENQDSPIRLLHTSFSDFLIDKRCTEQHCSDQFWVDEEQTHRNLAKRCLQLISSHLKRHMCNLKVPGFLANEVEKIRLEKNFSLHFLYACRLWVDHLERGYVDLCDDDNICGFLQKHFLNWHEALSFNREYDSWGYCD